MTGEGFAAYAERVYGETGRQMLSWAVMRFVEETAKSGWLATEEKVNALELLCRMARDLGVGKETT